MAERDVVLEISHVAKTFRLPTERYSGIKQAFINWCRGIKGYTEQHVLKDISLTVRRGDFVGIVGRNGSGKSTLLKIISGIYLPTKGSVRVNGSLVPFIELGVGFNPELTGRENVYLNGAMLGFSKSEIDKMYDDIVDFAELHDFMNQKLKNYSSGMQVRLAFSVAIKAQGDILVLDEVLAVGDEAFQRKCANFFERVKQDKNKTVILVTHDMGAVRRYCTSAIMIDGGKVVDSGDPDDVADSYSLENISSDPNARRALKEMKKNRASYIKGEFKSEPVLKQGDELVVNIEYKSVTERPVYVRAGLQVNNYDVTSANSLKLRGGVTNDQQVHHLTYRFKTDQLQVGDLHLVLALVDKESSSNVSTMGYNDEMPVKITNQDTEVAGLLAQNGKLTLK